MLYCVHTVVHTTYNIQHEESIPVFHDELGVEKNFVGWGVGMYVLLRLWVDD